MLDAQANEAIKTRLEIAKREFPGFHIVLKSESLLMKLLFYVSGMFLWNPMFMSAYVSTIGATMYVPKTFEGVRGLALLDHELQHMYDARSWTRPVWMWLYLFPQCLALLALLAFWNLWFLLALLALGPWPAPFRVDAEFRAYRKQIITLKNFGAVVTEHDTLWLRDIFCGWRYWRMSWGWSRLERSFIRVIDPQAVLRD